MKRHLRVLALLPWLLMSLWAGAPHDHDLQAFAPLHALAGSHAIAGDSVAFFASLKVEQDACVLCEWLAVAAACALGIALVCNCLRQLRRSFVARRCSAVFRVVPRRFSRGPPGVVFAPF